MLKKAGIISLISLTPIVSFSQGKSLTPLTIGSKVPYTVWKTVPKSKTAKLVILDFWSTFCSNCIAGFPAVESIQHQFKNEVQIVLVNSWESGDQINYRLTQINKNRDKNKKIGVPALPQVNSDKKLLQLFPCDGPPQHVWIDSGGKVVAITFPYNLTAKHVREFLKGDSVDLSEKKVSDGYTLFDDGVLKNPYSANAYYSILFKYDPSFGVGSILKRDSSSLFFRRTFWGSSIVSLFKVAFIAYGQKDIRVSNQIENKEMFSEPIDGDLRDDWKKKYLFGYEFQMPIEQEKKWAAYMQEDLNRYFGNLFGINAWLEKIKVKSLVLIRSGVIKLGSNNSKNYFERTDTGFKIVNNPFSDLVAVLKETFEDINAGRIVVDETGMDPKLKVDMQLTGHLKNVEDLRKQLQQYGLDIIEAEREVEVLVIRDKPQATGNK